MSEPDRKIKQTPESYYLKEKPEILAMAEAVVTLPESIKIPFPGAIG